MRNLSVGRDVNRKRKKSVAEGCLSPLLSREKRFHTDYLKTVDFCKPTEGTDLSLTYLEFLCVAHSATGSLILLT